MLVRADDVARRLLEAGKRRWPIGIAIFFIVVCADFAVTMHRHRTYTTEAKLVAKAGVRGTFIPIDAPAETYAELLTERPVAERVTADLRLDVTPLELLRHVVVHGVGVTPVLALDVSWSTPEMSATIANHLAEAFVERQRDLIAARSTQSIALIAGELPGAIKQQMRSAHALAEFQSRNGVVDMNETANGILAALTSIDAKIRDAEVEARAAGSTAVALKQQESQLPPTVDSQRTYAMDPSVTTLRSELADATAKRDAARGTYRANYPELVALERSVSALTNQIRQHQSNVMITKNVAPNSVAQDLSVQRIREQGQLTSTDFQLRELRRQRDSLARAFAAVPAKTARFAVLKREAQLSSDVVAALEQKSNEAVLARYSAASDVAIVQSAIAQSASVLPNVRTSLTAGLVVGVVLAIVSILAVDFFDDRIRNERDLTAGDYQLPVLASIPNTDATTFVAVSDAYGELVAALRGGSAGCRTLAIVSPLARDGKSTVALALARTLGEIEPGVLLVDGDLRNPTLHDSVSRPRAPGLSNVLADEIAFADVVDSIAPGVHFVSSGSFVTNTLTLLQSPRFEAFLAAARAVYRIIIIDAPALEPVLDGAVIAAQCDSAIVVISANRTAGRDLRSALQRLNVAGTSRIAGIVFNAGGRAPRPTASIEAITARLTGGVSA